MMKSLYEEVLKVVAKSAYVNAVISANPACLFYAYHLKLPENVQALRRL